MDGFTVTGGQVLAVLAVLLVVVLVAVAGRVLLAAAVIVGAQWAVITYWPGNTTLVWVVLGSPGVAGRLHPGRRAHRQHRARHSSHRRRGGAGDDDGDDHGWTAADLDRGRAAMVWRRAMVWASGPTPRAGRHRPGRGSGGRADVHIASACGVITGVQWAVLSQSGPGAAWVAVLSVPAFLAGATVTRLFAVLRIVHGRRRRVRGTRREREGRR